MRVLAKRNKQKRIGFAPASVAFASSSSARVLSIVCTFVETCFQMNMLKQQLKFD
jgi:hypothetical protein